MFLDHKLAVKLVRGREKTCVCTCIWENNWKQKKKLGILAPVPFALQKGKLN